MDFAAFKRIQTPKGFTRSFFLGSADCQRNQDLIAVQTGVPIAQMIDLKALNRLDDGSSDQQFIIRNTGHHFERIQKACR